MRRLVGAAGALTAWLLLAVTITFASCVVKTEPLGTVLLDSITRFNNTPALTGHLKVVLEVSRQLLQKRSNASKDAGAAALVQLLTAGQASSAGSVLETVQRLAESDPVLPILARRTLLAQLVLQWLAVGPGSPNTEAERELAELAKGFYGVHVSSVVRKGLLEYLHISKSGGTSFSYAAKQNDCDMPPGIGQLESLGDLPRWINRTAFQELTGSRKVMWSLYGEVERQTAARTCEERLLHVTSQGYNYVSNEYTLHGGLSDMDHTHVCPQVVNVVTLRNPMNRLTSHIHYMLPFLSRSVRRQTGRDKDVFNRVFCSGTPSLWDMVAPAVSDNYNIRSFVGERNFHAPVGGIGQEHVEVAQALLAQFDLVLDLDAGEEAAALIMGQGLGWSVTLSEVHARTSDKVTSKLGYNEDDCKDDGLAAVLPRQEPDMQLYSVGRGLSFLDSLFLALSRSLGLRPQPDPTSTAPAAATESEGCGLLGVGTHQHPAQGRGGMLRSRTVREEAEEVVERTAGRGGSKGGKNMKSAGLQRGSSV